MKTNLPFKTRQDGLSSLRLFSIVVLLMLTNFFVHGATLFYWGDNSNWSTLSNWSTSTSSFIQAPALPGANDDVLIMGRTVNIQSSDFISINSLKLYSHTTANATLNIASGASLTINRTTGATYTYALTFAGATINNNGGTISITNSVNQPGCYGVFFNNPDNGYAGSNNVLNNASGSLTVSTSTLTAASCYPICFNQTANGKSTLTTGGTIALIPPSGSGSRNYAIYCVSPDATINGNGTISVGSQATNAAYGLFYMLANASKNYSLTIGSNVTLNCYSTGFTTTSGNWIGPIFICSDGGNATFVNNGTINVGGNSTAGLHLVQAGTSITSFTNNGTMNFNGAFGLGAIHVTGGSTGASTFVNSSGANINYNTTTYQTTNKPLIYENQGKKISYTNSGTITIGTNIPLYEAFRFQDLYTSFTNSGTVNVGVGTINSAVATAAAPVVFTNSSAGVLNLTSTVNNYTLVPNNISLVNSGTINTAATNNILWFNTGVAGTTSGVSFENSSVLNPAGVGTGILTCTSSVLLKGVINMDVNGTTTPGTDYDLIKSSTANTDFNISNASLNLNINATNVTAGTTIPLIISYSTGKVTGTFQSITGLPNGWKISYSANAVNLTFDNTTNNTSVENISDLNNSIISINNTGIISKIDGKLKIYTFNGQMIQNENVNPNCLIKLTRGVYIVEIRTNNKSFIGKVII